MLAFIPQPRRGSGDPRDPPATTEKLDAYASSGWTSVSALDAAMR
jgi:hypothetical protein